MVNTQRIGPLRKVTTITRLSTSMYDQSSVVLECGHSSSTNGLKARCSECALTDGEWRAKAIPRLQQQLAEVEEWIARGNEMFGSHTSPGHVCARCRQANQIRKILNGA